MTATTMADDQKTTTTTIGDIVMRQFDRPEEPRRDSLYQSLKSRVTKRQMIVAVTGVVVLALIIAGILIGAWFYLDAAKQLVQRKFELDTGDKKVASEVTADLTENIVQYHSKNDDIESWVINDFNREIQVTKSRQQTGFTCYITPLNRTDAVGPEFIQNVTKPTGIIQTTTSYYRASPTAIKDKTILGKTAQTMCNNLDVFWIQEICEPQQNTTGIAATGRQKRYICGWATGCELGFHWCCYFYWKCSTWAIQC